MIPRLKPALGARELAALARVPSRGGVGAFEAAFAREMGQRHAVAFPYGRTGLVMVLKALGLEGREVICPAYTCVVVPHAVVAAGAEPVFVDSRPGDFNMDLELAREAITERTGAIVATSIFGYPVDLDRLDAIRRDFPHVRVIQDCAHSFAAEWRGRPVQREGDAAIFGLNVSKLVTSIFGGMVTTDHDELAHALRALREREVHPASPAKEARRLAYLLAVYPAFWPPLYTLVNRLERSGVLDRFVRYYDESQITMPGDYLEMMTSTEGWVGVAQLRRYRQIVERRRALAALYDRELRGLPGLELPPLVEGATYSHYVPRTGNRAALLDAALRRGVQLGQLIEYCIPAMQSYRARPAARPGPWPVADELSRTTVNLPLSAGERGARKVIGVLREVLR